MRLSFWKILSIILTTAVLCIAIYHFFSIRNSALKTLANERARPLEKDRVSFEKKRLIPHPSNKISIIQNTNFTTALVRFQDSFFAATNGGLVQYDDSGNLLKHYTVLDGLPESDLTALAVFRDKLFIGTRTKSLVVFDGKDFENFIFNDRDIQTVTTFLADENEIFIGTQKGGLLKFDGENFIEIKTKEKRFLAINCLQKQDAKLLVGTFDNGLWIQEADTWTHYTTDDKLPSNRVVGIIVQDGKIYIATDFGLAELQKKALRQIAVLPALSSAVLHENRIFLTKDNGEIFTFENLLKEFHETKNLQNSRLILIEEKLFLLSDQGIFTIKNAKVTPFSISEKNSLTDNFVSALTFDKNGNLWVGFFRRGIDIFGRDAKKITHLESEQIREINFLQAKNNSVAAAASSGLLNFKQDFSFTNLTKNEGLPSNSATHFSGDFFATSKGLAILQNGKIRVLSTVQNLPNNAVYTTLQTGKKFYAGTLGGLAEIENNRVVRVFKDSNSNLRTNWVTALIAVNERVFIGTYGGGIFELLPSGDFFSFESQTQKFVVNPNAVFSDGERLYAGTLAGIKVLDLETQEWKTHTDFLPSQTVLSITGDGENIFFGTANGIAEVKKTYFAEM